MCRQLPPPASLWLVGAVFTRPNTPYAVPDVAFDSPRIAGVPAMLAVSTSSTPCGVMVPRPTLPPVWYSAELPNFVAVFQMAMKFAFPLPVSASGLAAAFADLPGPAALLRRRGR